MELAPMLLTLSGAMLLIVSVLGCIALGKYIAAGDSPKTGKRGEVVYMLKVDAKGNVKIRKHRGNLTTWTDWNGNCD